MTDDIAIWTQNWPWTPVPEDGGGDGRNRARAHGGHHARLVGTLLEDIGHAQERKLLAVALGALRAVFAATLHEMDELVTLDLVDHFGLNARALDEGDETGLTTTGQVLGDHVVIESGLSENERVVLTGQVKLRNGAGVKVDNSVSPKTGA